MDIKIVKRKSLVVFSILFCAAIMVLFGAVATKYLWLNSTSNTPPQPDQSWPTKVVPIEYKSTADNTLQPALFYKPDVNNPSPLLVALHTWSGDYRQYTSIPYAEWCIKNKWVFIHPNFRGPNNKPEATGSDMVIQDILSAVEYTRNNSNIDPNRIYLVGVSGGGYTALVVSAKHPDIWAGVSVWASITDLSAWYFQSKQLHPQYADDIVKSLEGIPGYSTKVNLAYRNRSPITYLATATFVPIDINAGINDGHTGSVPISHSLLAFNALAAPENRLSEEDIGYFVEHAKVPTHLIDPLLSDTSYGKKAPLFRRQSQNARITIFNGNHEIIFYAALLWLAQQRK
jgi:pimeloyl-ACP methyl ester carboxylesterase